MSLPNNGPFSIFAITAPGLEAICAQEVASLGLVPQIEPGGVSFTGSKEALYLANLSLRTASRLLLRIASFEARAFYELEKHARKLPWGRFLTKKTVCVRVSCHKSKLYHSDAVKERILDAIARSVGPISEAASEDEDGAAQLFLIRFMHDRCTVSVDTSGALLHLRGYRQATAKAPLRETLAAAMLLASGWDRKAPLVDPMCGSGTIPIEAALWARQIAPGLSFDRERGRPYAFQEWPDFDAGLWEKLLAQERAKILPSCGPILGSDLREGAIEASTSNASRAGVSQDISFSQKSFSEVIPPEETGWLLTNPPYGVRIGDRENIQKLYRELGAWLRQRLVRWKVALLSSDTRFDSQLGLRTKELFRTSNGGIPIRLLLAQPTHKNR